MEEYKREYYLRQYQQRLEQATESHEIAWLQHQIIIETQILKQKR
jgi:hypothetical protein